MFCGVYMIIEFLDKLYSELLEEKLELESKINRSTISLNENMRYIEKLKKEDDINFDVFSPRKQNVALRENIKSLEEKYDELSHDLEDLNDRLVHVNFRIDEVNLVIKTAKKQSINLDRNIEFSNTSLYDFCFDNFTSIEHKIRLCSTLLDVDPIRCKLELTSISKMISEAVEQMERGIV